MAFTPGRLASALEDCLGSLAEAPSGLVVGLSGGLDSTVLLAGISQVNESGCGWPVRAVHVDHGLHPDSPLWARHCEALAKSFGVPLLRVRVDARPRTGESPEAASRRARYAAFARSLAPREILCTAHHADDQLETILLQWLRGGGLRAVAGMRSMAPFAAGWHARPMLGFLREELRAWADSASLHWLEDPSNVDPRFDRNYLRLEVLPTIRRRWPAVARTAGRIAAQAAEALAIEVAIADADLASVEQGEALSLERLRSLPEGRQRWALRAWLRRRELPTPAARTLAALLKDALVAAPDRVPCVNWPGARVYRYRGRLYGVDPASVDAPLREGRLSPPEGFDLGALGRLEFEPAVGVGLSQSRLPADLSVVARQRGATFRPGGAAHARPLRKWWQEWGVLPWRRHQVPLVLAGDELAVVGDWAFSTELAAAPDEPSWRMTWRGRPTVLEQDALKRTHRN